MPPPELLELVLKGVEDSRKESREGFRTLYEAMSEIRSDVAAVRDAHAETQQRVASLEGINKGEELATAAAFGPEAQTNGTGRHRVPLPSRPEMVIPTPEPGTSVEVRFGHSSRRSSDPAPSIVGLVIRSFKTKVARAIGIALAGLALPVLGALVHRWLAPAPPPTVVYVPAPASATAARTP